MPERSRVLCVIPARGGSKRIPGKNTAPFHGRPMIVHALETAKDSGVFDEIHVSTDAAEIRAVAEAAGFPVPFLRLAALADDMTPILPVLRWVLAAFAERGREFDAVCCLMPCTPLLVPDDLVRGLAALGDDGVPSISVVPYPAPIEWAYAIDADGLLQPVRPEALTLRSQDLATRYYDAGAFAFFPAARVRDEGYMGGGVMRPVILPRQRSVDIDHPDDIAFAELLYRGRAAP